ncbi:HEAT repeat domain-containing protein [bacterium]|nr:HEAT repeat domain-containing protein [bacterium]
MRQRWFKRWAMVLCLVGVCFFLSVSLTKTAVWAENTEDVGQILATMKKAIIEKNDPMRNRMYFKLRIMGKPAVNPLIEVLSDPEPGVSEYAVFVLGWIADPDAIEAMKDYLKKGNESQKKAALQALGNMAWGTDEAVRKEVHARAVDEMMKYLDDPSQVVRREAAYGLGLAGSTKAIPILQKYVNDSDELMRYFAKEAIDRIENTPKGF